MKSVLVLVVAILSGCAVVSDPMRMSDGTYLVTSTTPPGPGRAGAVQAAQKEAQTFCAKKGLEAVLVEHQTDDTAVGGSFASGSVNKFGGGFSGGGFFGTKGQAQLKFICK